MQIPLHHKFPLSQFYFYPLLFFLVQTGKNKIETNLTNVNEMMIIQSNSNYHCHDNKM